MIVISDTSPISGLFLIRYLHLLKWLYGKVILPKAVLDELLRLTEFGHDLSEITHADWIEVLEPTDWDKVRELRINLDEGESQAIALAKELSADLLLIDEARGRTFAKAEGLAIVGLLGVLLEAKAKRHIPKVKPLLELLVNETSFRIDTRLIREILEIAGEFES